MYSGMGDGRARNWSFVWYNMISFVHTAFIFNVHSSTGANHDCNADLCAANDGFCTRCGDQCACPPHIMAPNAVATDFSAASISDICRTLSAYGEPCLTGRTEWKTREIFTCPVDILSQH